MIASSPFIFWLLEGVFKVLIRPLSVLLFAWEEFTMESFPLALLLVAKRMTFLVGNVPFHLKEDEELKRSLINQRKYCWIQKHACEDIHLRFCNCIIMMIMKIKMMTVMAKMMMMTVIVMMMMIVKIIMKIINLVMILMIMIIIKEMIMITSTFIIMILMIMTIWW